MYYVDSQHYRCTLIALIHMHYILFAFANNMLIY